MKADWPEGDRSWNPTRCSLFNIDCIAFPCAPPMASILPWRLHFLLVVADLTSVKIPPICLVTSALAGKDSPISLKSLRTLNRILFNWSSCSGRSAITCVRYNTCANVDDNNSCVLRLSDANLCPTVCEIL